MSTLPFVYILMIMTSLISHVNCDVEYRNADKHHHLLVSTRSTKADNPLAVKKLKRINNRGVSTLIPELKSRYESKFVPTLHSTKEPGYDVKNSDNTRDNAYLLSGPDLRENQTEVTESENKISRISTVLTEESNITYWRLVNGTFEQICKHYFLMNIINNFIINIIIMVVRF